MDYYFEHLYSWDPSIDVIQNNQVGAVSKHNDKLTFTLEGGYI
jgi:hypothetical protein